MAYSDTDVVGGVDTHKDSHTIAALSGTVRLLGTAQCPATLDGYQELVGWLRGFGRVVRVGVEGTGSYGTGLHAALRQAGIDVREVVRPKRQVRRRRGKSDPVDAEVGQRAAGGTRRLRSVSGYRGRVRVLPVTAEMATATAAPTPTTSAPSIHRRLSRRRYRIRMPARRRTDQRAEHR